MNSPGTPTQHDRLDCWYDGSAICVIAVGSHGDPLDLSEDETKAFIERLKKCVKDAAGDAS
jgi:hypothetical protein